MPPGCGQRYTRKEGIAHGGNPDFIRAALHGLKNRETVADFLREVIKLVLVTALSQPELVSDLKSC